MFRSGQHGVYMSESTNLPPFQNQINHLVNTIKSSKVRRRPLLVEGPAGLGKGTALQQWVCNDIYLSNKYEKKLLEF